MIAHGWLTAANLVTISRILLTPVVVTAIVRNEPLNAAAWFALAALTDFLDGWLARMRRVESTVGQYLDPIADKLLLNGVFVALAIQGSAPRWFVGLVLGRDAAIVIASAIAMKISTYTDYRPTLWGKLSTLLQILAAVAVMGSNAAGGTSIRTLADWAVGAAAAGTAWSAVHYTWRGVRYFVRRSGGPMQAKR